MKDICDICGKTTDIFEQTLENEEGIEIRVKICSECLRKSEDSNAYFEIPEEDYTDADLSEESDEDNTELHINWAKIVKILNIIIMIATTIISTIIGTIIGEEFLRDGAFLGGFIGLITGILIGGSIVAFSMLFVEISQNLSAVLEEIQKNK